MFEARRNRPLLNRKWERRPTDQTCQLWTGPQEGLLVQRAVITEDFFFRVVSDGVKCVATAHHLQQVAAECKGKRGPLRGLNLSSACSHQPACPHLPRKLPESPVTMSWTKKKGWNTGLGGRAGEEEISFVQRGVRRRVGAGLGVTAEGGGAVAKGRLEEGQDRRTVHLGEGIKHTVTEEKAGHLRVRLHTVKIVFVYLPGVQNRVGDIEGQALARGTAD